MTLKYDCLACRKQVTATKNNRYWAHTDGSGESCENSKTEIPQHVLDNPVGEDDAPDVPREHIDFAVCPQCDRKVKLTRMGYFEPHDTTLKGGERCEVSGVRHKHARKTETVPLPGDEPKSPMAALPAKKDSETPPAKVVEAARAASPASTGSSDTTTTAVKEVEGEMVGPLTHPPAAEAVARHDRILQPSPVSTPTSESSTPPEPADSDSGSDSSGPFQMRVSLDPRVLQPFSFIQQPGEIPVRLKISESMSERGKEIAARLREIFHAYTNRDTKDNRSAQKTLGPSEIGSPCDRQLAMKLLGIKPVNPQEGWAPFVGTAVHKDLAEMFEWANGAGSGRFHTELPVSFGSALVPHGTLDLYDGVLYMVDDHKLMGRWSLNKLVQEGPSETYRIQVHTYGYGAELAGFKVREVCIIGWPRQESSLDNLYVHVEKYDRKIAKAAIARVERLAVDVYERGQGPFSQMEVAQQMATGDDCKWCPFYLKGDKEMERGCPGS